MDLEKISAEQEALLAEFQTSGLSADEFIRKYLAGKGIAEPEKVMQEINSTLEDIDRNYAEIKRAKEQGKDRRSYLRSICDTLFANSDSRKAGRALQIVACGLEGKENSPAALEYDGFDAVNLIASLDDAIRNSTLASLCEEGNKNE